MRFSHGGSQALCWGEERLIRLQGCSCEVLSSRAVSRSHRKRGKPTGQPREALSGYLHSDSWSQALCKPQHTLILSCWNTLFTNIPLRFKLSWVSLLPATQETNQETSEAVMMVSWCSSPASRLAPAAGDPQAVPAKGMRGICSRTEEQDTSMQLRNCDPCTSPRGSVNPRLNMETCRL